MDEHGYRQLEVWQRAMDLVDAIYGMTKLFPDDERFGLISQLRRAAVSIPSNIAEGYGRSHRKEYVQHLSIARGPLMELETQIIVSVRQTFIGRDDARPTWDISQEVGRMLTRLIQSLR